MNLTNKSVALKSTSGRLILTETIYYLTSIVYSSTNTLEHVFQRYCLSISFIILPSCLGSYLQRFKPQNSINIYFFTILNVMLFMNKIDLELTIGHVNTLENRKNEVAKLAFEGLWKFIMFDMLTTQCLNRFLNISLILRILSVAVIPNQQIIMLLQILFQVLILIAWRAVHIPHTKSTFTELFGLKNDKRSGSITEDKILEQAVTHFPEGVAIINPEGKLSFSNSYFKIALKLDTNMALQELSNRLGDLEFQEISTPIVGSLISIHEPGTIYNTKPSIDSIRPFSEKSEETTYREALQKITSLEALFTLTTKSPEILKSAQKYVAFFHTRHYHQGVNEWHTIEIKARLILGTADERYLLILLKNITEVDAKTITLEKEKTVYRENLLASFSHELKTPLNSNLAFLEQSIDSPLIPTEVKNKLIKPALTSGRLLFFLVSDILDYSLLLANQFKLDIKPQDLAKTINHCLELIQLKLGHKMIKFQLTIERDVPEIYFTDHKRLAQILINLLRNAIQFTVQGKIEIIVSPKFEDCAQIAVKDTGVGMVTTNQQRLEHLLSKEDFKHSMKASSTGIGLGLLVSSKLVKMLNPSQNQGIQFLSEEGKGSTFFFIIKNMKPESVSAAFSGNSKRISSLEIDQQASLNMKIRHYNTRTIKNTFSSSKPGSFRANRNRVLVVDDEIFNIIVIENFCKPFDISVEKALNGKEAIEKLRECAQDGLATIKIVFMDINMPVMDGYEATRKIHTLVEEGEIEDVTVVGVTAYNSWDKVEKGYRSGMTEVLNKPLAKDVVIDVLKKYGII